jgi:serine/threonine protein kinase
LDPISTSKSIAKLADFGTVREDDREQNLSANDAVTRVTHAQTMLVVGTQPYMPSE